MHINHYLKYTIFTGLLKLSTLLKATFILGVHTVSFSASSAIYPVLGAFSTVRTLGMLFAIPVLVKVLLLAGIPPLYHLAYHIPGFCAALVWAKPSWRLGIIIPLVSLGAFLLNPIGFQAGYYTLYWLIPLCLSLTSWQHPFFKALTGTFVAHAVGSVIWLYTMPMTPDQWLGLIPVVAVERFCFALGATGLYYCIAAYTSKNESTVDTTVEIPSVTHKS